MTTAADDDSSRAEDTAEALARVEAELAFQNDNLRELGDALATQQLDILSLREQVRLLGEQLKAARSEWAERRVPAPADDDPPPHY